LIGFSEFRISLDFDLLYFCIMPNALDTYIRFQPASRSEWRAWLKANHAQKDSIWLVMPKKGSGIEGVALSEAVDEALCFGWIDSLPRALDDQRSMLLISPRKPKSNWSAVNKAKVERLAASGLIAPPGQKMIDLAKANGTWDALNSVEALETPDDLAAALANYENAATNWDAFPRSTKRGILEWILNAKAPETRAKRVAETAEKAGRNERANQWKKT
jgi:uncharacterized protein YdeI (YjbR/CyaY-like superfamily)